MGDPVLKPCPFCGARDIRHHATRTFVIGRRFECMVCHAEGPPARWDLKGVDARDTDRLRMNEALSRWNRRADPSETLREALTNLVLAVEAGKPDAIAKALSHARAALEETGGTDG